MFELLPDAAPAPSVTLAKRARYSEKLPREFSRPGTAGQDPQDSWFPGTTLTGICSAVVGGGVCGHVVEARV
jgi:hypothetical protein